MYIKQLIFRVLLYGGIVFWHGFGFAQERPSLQALEQQQLLDRAANCAKADIDGDSYRPFYCDAVCMCAGQELSGTIDVCSVSPAGATVTGDVLTQTCDQVTPNGFACSARSGATCLSDSNCSNGETCIDADPPFGSGFCGNVCSVDADCATDFTVSFSPVGTLTEVTPVSCSLTGGESGQQPVNINHNDARACLILAGCMVCGDGVVDTNEGCDDGNISSGDGCSAACEIE